MYSSKKKKLKWLVTGPFVELPTCPGPIWSAGKLAVEGTLWTENSDNFPNILKPEELFSLQGKSENSHKALFPRLPQIIVPENL